MMIPEADFRVQYLDPRTTKIRGSVSVDPEGFATIFINPRLDPDRQLKTFEHELRHFNRNDFYNDKSIHEVEDKAEPMPALPAEQPPVVPLSRASPRLQIPPNLPTRLRSRHYYLISCFEEARAKLPDELLETMDNLFSHRVTNVSEMHLRGFLLYGLKKDSPYWTQILKTYTLYGINLPEFLPRDAGYVVGKHIPHEAMINIVYALVEAAIL